VQALACPPGLNFSRARVHFPEPIPFCLWLGILPRGAGRAAPFQPGMPGTMAYQDLIFHGLKALKMGASWWRRPRHRKTRQAREHTLYRRPEGSEPRRESSPPGSYPHDTHRGVGLPSYKRFLSEKGREKFLMPLRAPLGLENPPARCEDSGG
jgi:hypothetical protein